MQAGGQLPCWIFIFATHSLSYRKSNSKENIKFSDSSCNRMKVIGNLKIQDGGQPPCWIFIFMTHSLSCPKSNSEAITSSFVILTTIEGMLLAIKKCKLAVDRNVDFLCLQYIA